MNRTAIPVLVFLAAAVSVPAQQPTRARRPRPSFLRGGDSVVHAVG